MKKTQVKIIAGDGTNDSEKQTNDFLIGISGPDTEVISIKNKVIAVHGVIGVWCIVTIVYKTL